MWWQDAVVYQVYPRSFQDSDGDGIGDLRGIASRLDHLAELGVDALWLSPIYPSPLADFGYDIADFCAIDPVFGALADFDALVAAAHERGLRVLLDIVANHTSIEHPWFRDHPERYVFSPVDGPANNWIASFGGPAWSRDPHGRGWYLHSFYPEQPDLDWRNPAVAAAIGGVMRFWLERGVDGFRLDAIDRIGKDPDLRDDPPADPATPFPLPLQDEHATLDHLHSGNAPDIGDLLARLHAELPAAAEAPLLVGEVYLDTARLGPYLEHLDLAFGFEFLHAPWAADALRAAIEPALALGGRIAWVRSNHDFGRLATQVGPENARAATVLLLTLPGTAFLYQGDEIGQGEGPGATPPLDRHGRDVFRHPMAWEPGPLGGFTTGTPWLAVVDADRCNVADQRTDPASVLALVRALIALRGELRGPARFLDGLAPDLLAFERGAHVVVVNTGPAARPLPSLGTVALATAGGVAPGAPAPSELPAHAALVTRRAAA